MSLSAKRKARKNTRTTLSGKVIPAETAAPRLWGQVVAESKEAFEEKFGRDYPQAEFEPRPTEYAIVADGKTFFGKTGPLADGEEVKFEGTNRAARRERLKSVKGGRMLLGSYTRVLHRSLGDAYGNHWEARRLMRDRAKAARLAERLESVAS
jgi:hypothetical protein